MLLLGLAPISDKYSYLPYQFESIHYNYQSLTNPMILIVQIINGLIKYDQFVWT